MLRKMFLERLPQQWKIVEKDLVDEIIFRTMKPRNRIMLELMARGGMRVGEILKIRPMDIQDRKITLAVHLADQSTRNRNARERVVLPEVHWRHHQRRLYELLDRMDRAKHAVLRGEHDPVGNLYKLPEEREVL